MWKARDFRRNRIYMNLHSWWLFHIYANVARRVVPNLIDGRWGSIKSIANARRHPATKHDKGGHWNDHCKVATKKESVTNARARKLLPWPCDNLWISLGFPIWNYSELYINYEWGVTCYYLTRVSGHNCRHWIIKHNVNIDNVIQLRECQCPMMWCGLS